MEKNKFLKDRALFQLIKKLNRRELSNFIDYLYSEEFKLKENSKIFFTYVTTNHPIYTYDLTFLLKEFFVGPKTKGLLELNAVCSQINKILERWLVYQEAVNNPIIYQQLKTQAYYKYASPEKFLKILDKVPDVLAEAPIGELEVHHAQFIIASYKFHHPDTERLQVKQTPEQLSDYLDDYYVGNKLRLYCQYLSRGNIINKTSGFILSQEIKAYARKKSSNLYYKLYLTLIQLYEEDKQVLIPEIKANYEQYFKTIHKKSVKRIIKILFVL